MPPRTAARICAAFRAYAADKLPRRPLDAGDTVMFMIEVVGMSAEKVTHEEVLAVLRRRGLIS